MSISYKEFKQRYFILNKLNTELRFGQMFINYFIKESSSLEMVKLWEEKDFNKAEDIIIEIVENYCWDWNKLPVIVSRESLFN